MFKYIRDNYPNVYIFIVGICVACWFKGINIMLKLIIKEKNIYIALGLIIFSTLILYLDDGSLSELKNIRNAAAINLSNDHSEM